jgi:hypothetical protein
MPPARMRPPEAWQALGLPAAPTIHAVKAAYRRLAKSVHPDAVGTNGDAARFARLTEAYEVALAEAAAAGRRGAPAARAEPPTRPRRPPRARPGREASEATTERPRATPGSTSYDGAQSDDEDPPWGGAEWVGADSGTYWRVNPKEYADPRKHGAEYRARGRRPVHHERRERAVMQDDDTAATEFSERASAHVPARSWPSVEWRLFYALIASTPSIALAPLLPGVGVQLLILGIALVLPPVAWVAAYGTAALGLVVAPWLLLAQSGLPLPATEGPGLLAALIWAGAYLLGALLAAAGRLRSRPWLALHAG